VGVLASVIATVTVTVTATVIVGSAVTVPTAVTAVTAVRVRARPAAALVVRVLAARARRVPVGSGPAVTAARVLAARAPAR